MKRLVIFAGLTAAAVAVASIVEIQKEAPALAQEQSAPEPYKSSRAYENGPPCVATYARFMRLKQGYPAGFVKNLMKCEGTMVSSQRIGTCNYRTVRWDGERPGSFMMVTYCDYVVNSLSQFGLQ